MKRKSLDLITPLALEAFSSGAYISINKKLLANFGPGPAVFLSNLVDKLSYFLREQSTKDGDWFYLTHADQMEYTGMTENQIKECKKLFKRNGILEIKWKGQPGREYYRINFEKLCSAIDFNLMLYRESEKNIVFSDGLARGKSLGLARGKSGGLSFNNKPKLNKPKGKITIPFESFLMLFPNGWQEDEPFYEALLDFHNHRIRMKHPLTALAAKKIKNTLIPVGTASAIAALDISVMNDWRGVFPQKNNEPSKGKESNGPISAPIEEWYENQSQRPFSKTLAEMWLTGNERDQAKTELWNRTPSSESLVNNFETWLEKQDWISTKDAPGLYRPDGPTFKKFLAEFQHDIGVDIITGEEVY